MNHSVRVPSLHSPPPSLVSMRPLTDPVNWPNAKVKGSSPTIGAQRQVRKESFHTSTGRDGMIAEKETGRDRQRQLEIIRCMQIMNGRTYLKKHRCTHN